MRWLHITDTYVADSRQTGPMPIQTLVHGDVEQSEQHDAQAGTALHRRLACSRCGINVHGDVKERDAVCLLCDVFFCAEQPMPTNETVQPHYQTSWLPDGTILCLRCAGITAVAWCGPSCTSRTHVQ